MTEGKKRHTYKRNIGKAGEEAAVSYLQQREGWHIVETNYTCPLGEIDIVAREGETLVFIEVRSTGSAHFALIEESINRRKQKKIKQVAAYYAKERKVANAPCRIDVFLVEIDPKTLDEREIRWIENAF